ncbi:hypothetical protein H8D30_04535 [bacterium]|nr:hypothetical protein [bacterium]
MKVVLCVGTLEPGRCGVGDFVRRLALEMGEGVRAWSPGGESLHLDKEEIIHLHMPSVGWSTGEPWSLFCKAPRNQRVLTLHEWRLSHPLRKVQSLFLSSLSSQLVFVDPAEAASFPFGTQEILPVGPALTGGVLGSGTPKRFRLVFFGFLSKSKDLEDLALWFQRSIVRGWDAPLAFVGNEGGDSRIAQLVQNVPTLEVRERLSASEISSSLQWGDVGILPFRDGTSPRRTTLLGLLSSGIPVLSPPPYQPPFRATDFPPWGGDAFSIIEGDYVGWVSRQNKSVQGGWSIVVKQHREFYEYRF